MKRTFTQVPAREIAPGSRLLDGKIVEMVATSGNDHTVAVWIDGVARRMAADRTLPVVNS